jgi:hypothetical protein
MFERLTDRPLWTVPASLMGEVALDQPLPMTHPLWAVEVLEKAHPVSEMRNGEAVVSRTRVKLGPDPYTELLLRGRSDSRWTRAGGRLARLRRRSLGYFSFETLIEDGHMVRILYGPDHRPQGSELVFSEFGVPEGIVPPDADSVVDPANPDPAQ